MGINVAGERMKMKPGDKIILKVDSTSMVAKKGATGVVGPKGMYDWELGGKIKMIDVIWDKDNLLWCRQNDGDYFADNFELIVDKIDYLTITKEIVGRKI